MCVIIKQTKNPEHKRVLIVESVREDGKVKQKILSNIGVARNPTQLAVSETSRAGFERYKTMIKKLS